jgi:ACR3 family arsenite efflux pump ArsB
MAMLWSVFVHVPLRRMGGAFRDLRFTAWSLGINFLWIPLFAYALGWVFLRDRPDLWVGLIMLLVTPCTDWYLVFTNLAGGNVRLSTALLPWHLVLQLLLLPIYLLLFAGALVRIGYGVVVKGVVLVLAVPLALAWAFRCVAEAVRGRAWLTEKVLPRVADAQLPFLMLAIAAMFASEGAVLLNNPLVIVRLLVPLLLFFVTTVLLAVSLSRRVGFGYPECASLCFATLARNSPVALAIAVVAFPERPLVALALVVGPLIELPVLAVVAQGLRTARSRLDWGAEGR